MPTAVPGCVALSVGVSVSTPDGFEGGKELGDAEVEDLDVPVLRDEDVLGLDVAVDDPLLVRRGKAVSDLDGVVDGLLRRQGSAELFAERFALQKLRDDEGASLVRPDVVDDEDVGVIELGGGAGFLLEAREAFGIRGEAGVDDLDRDVTAEPRVPRPVNLAHAARAERRQGSRRARGGCRGKAS